MSSRQWDMARIIPIGRLAELSGPSRVPCLPLRTCGVPAFVLIPASIPAHPSAHVLELPFYGASSWLLFVVGLRRREPTKMLQRIQIVTIQEPCPVDGHFVCIIGVQNPQFMGCCQ